MLASHRRCQAGARRAQEKRVLAQSIGQGLGAGMGDSERLVHSAFHQRKALQRLIGIRVALKSLRREAHLPRVFLGLGEGPGLASAVTMNGIGLADPIGCHRVMDAVVLKTTGTDAVGPWHQGERCQGIAIQAASPGASKIQFAIGAV